MKIDKAIEIMERPCGQSSGLTLKEILEAEELALEALKRVNIRRDKLSWEFEPLLPGEDKE